MLRVNSLCPAARGKPLYCLVLATAYEGNQLFAESVEILTEDNRNMIADSLSREMTFATHIYEASKSLPMVTEWTDQASPHAAKSCKRLGRSPTANALEPLLQTPDNKKKEAGSP